MQTEGVAEGACLRVRSPPLGGLLPLGMFLPAVQTSLSRALKDVFCFRAFLRSHRDGKTNGPPPVSNFCVGFSALSFQKLLT